MTKSLFLQILYLPSGCKNCKLQNGYRLALKNSKIEKPIQLFLDTKEHQNLVILNNFLIKCEKELATALGICVEVTVSHLISVVEELSKNEPLRLDCNKLEPLLRKRKYERNSRRLSRKRKGKR